MLLSQAIALPNFMVKNSVSQQLKRRTPDATTIPTKIILLAENKMVLRGSNVDNLLKGNSTIQFEDVSPTNTGFIAGSFDLAYDPFNPKSYLVLFGLAVWRCDDIWASHPVWQQVAQAQQNPNPQRSPDTLIGNIKASESRPGFFCWLAVRDENQYLQSTLLMYYTDNNFASIQTVQVGEYPIGYGGYNGTVCPALELGHFNTASRGDIFAHPVLLSSGGVGIYHSADWGLTWSQYNVVSDFDTAMYMPYSKPGGGDNVDNSGLMSAARGYFYLDTQQKSVISAYGLPGSASNSDGYGAHYNILSLKTDANYVAVHARETVQGHSGFLISNDNGVTWIEITTIPWLFNYPEVDPGVSGSPSNKNFLVAWRKTDICLSNDRGTTWTSLTLALQPIIGSDTRIVRVLADPLDGYQGPDDPSNTGAAFCPLCWIGELFSRLPVGLHHGEKSEEATDLSLTTPTGMLAFTRTYRQSKQSVFQVVGRGWTHNHVSYLKVLNANNLMVLLPNGGELFLSLGAGGVYQSALGSTATAQLSGSNYVLTAMDKSQYTFQPDPADVTRYRLLTIQWPSHEQWNYHYDTTSGQLTSIDDNYQYTTGQPLRQLVFRYYTSGPATGQLFRVGDQTFSDTDPTHPTGRYVEYAYIRNKKVDGTGAIVTDSGNLLSNVRDVRGYSWSYTYYGQNANETDTRQLNYLTGQQSPKVDATGSGGIGRAITLKQLKYTLQSIEQVTDGDMETTQSWPSISGAAPSSNTRVSTPVHSGSYSRSVSTSAINQGIESNSLNLLAGHTYSLTAWVYPTTGSTVKMQLIADANVNQNSSGANAWELLRLIYQPTSDVAAKLQFVSATASASFYVDSVSVADVTVSTLDQQNGDAALLTHWAFQPGGQNITTETTGSKTTTHVFDNGAYVGAQDPGGNFNSQFVNRNYRPDDQTDANGNVTQMAWSADGSQLNAVTDALGHKTNFSYNIGGNSDGTLSYSLDAQGRKTQYTYGDTLNPRLPTEVKVFNTNGVTALRWQKFGYDGKGRTLTEQTLDPTNGTLQQQVTRAYYADATGNPGSGLLQSVVQQDVVNPANNLTTTYFYDSAGRIKRTKQSATFGSCISSFSLYDAAGNVIASLCNYDPASGADPTTVAQALALFNSAVPDVNKVTLYEYDPLNRRVKTTTDAGAPYAQVSLTVYDGLSRVIRTISNYVADPAISDPFVHARADFKHGVNNDQNLVSDTTYNERGFVRSQTDVLGNVTLFGYDDAGRLIKTIASAGQPAYDNSYGPNGDPDLSKYVASSAPDLDLMTLNQYDAVGNLVKTTDAVGSVTLMGYDALNRPVKTVRSASSPTYDWVSDPTLSQYIASDAADLDLIDMTQYDAMGRVIRTQDALGSWTLYGYDALGRQVKVVRSASQSSYDLVTDPSLASYSVSDAPDQDVVTTTTYDPFGRVMYSTDPLGRKTWSAYDGLNRVVRTVGNATGSATDGSARDPRSPGYSPVALSDQDLIATTTYDSNGYTLWTQDTLGRKTWYGYDAYGRQVRTVSNALGVAQDGGANDPRSPNYAPSPKADQDVVNATEYDMQGRVAATVDPAGRRTQYTYDTLGRRLKTIANAVTGTYRAALPDQDLVSTASYDVAGRVVATIDPRGTQTTFAYDRAGRRLTITQAAGTALATTSYTCYDKGGRVLRVIQNYRPDPRLPAPDARDDAGRWLFNPAGHGLASDQNLITTYLLDRLGRQTAVVDALGNLSLLTYAKDGQVISMTEPGGTLSQYRYDKLRRRTLVVQNYKPGTLTDPSAWTWNPAAARWQDGRAVAIPFGSANDQNLITQVQYDKASRVLAQRDPKGSLTRYRFDLLNRRTSLTNPLNYTWTMRYVNQNDTQQTTLTDPEGNVMQQYTDRLGRLATLRYTDASTPDVAFSYDKLGNRLQMTETSNTGAAVRTTRFSYDGVRRLTRADFDTDGNGTIDQSVSYQYDAGGLRTRLTLPGSLTVSYTYDARGQLLSLSDWSSQQTQYRYDALGRLAAVARPNGLLSQYRYDPAGRLSQERHSVGSKVLGQFVYTVDARGNRIQAYEAVPKTGTGGAKTYAYSDAAIRYSNSGWTASSPFMVSTARAASLSLAFFGAGTVSLKMGVGPDHSIYDIYIDGDLWNSADGYAAAATDTTFSIPVQGDGPHTLEVRNRPEKNLQSSGYQIRFESFATPATSPALDLQTTLYTYDALSRLTAADVYPGANTAATATAHYGYSYDVNGNLLSQVTPSGTTTLTYDAANQVNSTGYTYFKNGNLKTDPTSSYTWDKANRLLSVGSAAYLYNGLGQRVQQTVSATVTQYLLDMQPGLFKVLSATSGANTTRYVHGPLGIQQQQNPSSAWNWLVQDGLGSVRNVLDNSAALLESRQYDPYGNLLSGYAQTQSPFGFTGEQVDSNNLLYLRARYYNPKTGSFLSLDPLEGDAGRPLSLNRFAYVQGNPINRRDPSGLKCTASQMQGAVATVACAIEDEIERDADGVVRWVTNPDNIQRLAETATDLASDAATYGSLAATSTAVGSLEPAAALGLAAELAPFALVGGLIGIPLLILAIEAKYPATIPESVKLTLRQAQGQYRPPTPQSLQGQSASASATQGASQSQPGSRLNPATCPNPSLPGEETESPEPEELVGYHGTSSTFTASILAGIKPSSSTNFANRPQLGPGFYVVSKWPSGTLSVILNTFAEISVNNYGGTKAFFKVFARGFRSMTSQEVPRVQWRNVPANFNTDFDYLYSAIQDFEMFEQIKFNERAYGKLRAELVQT